MTMENKPECKLVGTDSNVFALASRVSKALIKSGQKDRAKEFSDQIFQCESYGEALNLMGEYVEIYQVKMEVVYSIIWSKVNS